MLATEYDNELHRLQQIGPVDVPHIAGVKTIVKDRLAAHTYEPMTLERVKLLGPNPVLADDLDSLRSQTHVQQVVQCHKGNINVESQTVNELGRRVHYLKIYKTGLSKTNNVLVYIHGGAYYGGSSYDTILPLRMIATRFKGVIYSLDYGLSPEHPYPNGLLDCLAAVLAISKKHSKLTIAGDSAGGSLALGVSQLANQMGINQIENHILFYPTVVHGSNHNGPLWDDSRISIIPNERPFLHSSYQQFKQLDHIMTKHYLADQKIDLKSPIISPMYADPTLFKKVTILVGEYDPFRLQDEAFAEQVGTAGGDVTFVRYGGMGHGFLNYLGKVAASEDVLHEALKNI